MNLPLYFPATKRPVWETLAKPSVFASLLLVYWGAHLFARLSLSDTFQVDGAEQIYLSQWLKWDYGNIQPPVLTWFYWGLWQVIDPSLESFVVSRYVILGLASWIWYRIACLLFEASDWRFIAAISWLLVGELGWKLHQGSTHTTLLILALIMSFHAICLISKFGRSPQYVYLGVALGLGVLSKYTFATFVFPALLAALSMGSMRTYLLNLKILYSVVPALFGGSVALFSVGSVLSLSSGVDQKAGVAFGGLIMGQFDGFGHMIWAVLGFCAPFLIILLPALGSRPKGLPQDEIQRFLSRFFVVVFACLIVFVALFDIGEVKQRWMHPLLLFVPFWVIGWMANRVYRLPASLMIVSLVSLGALSVGWGQYQKLEGSAHGGIGSRPTWPVSAAIEELPRWSDSGNQVVCAADAFIAAHLRVARSGPRYVAGSNPECSVYVSGQVHLADQLASIPANATSATAVRHKTAYTVWYESR